MNAKRNILEKLFDELKGLYSDSTQYKAFLKDLYEELKISYEADEDLERLLKKLLDKLCSSGCSENYKKVLKKVKEKIDELQFIKSVEGLWPEKNNDQGLTL